MYDVVDRRFPFHHVGALAALGCLLTSGARAIGEGEVAFGSHDVASVFFVAKSQNRNQVHYGIRLDRNCAPIGSEPVHAYWRMLEEHDRIEPLLNLEQGAYGVTTEQISPSGVRVLLRAFPRRAVTIATERTGDRCRATATTEILGGPARLENVYVRLRWPFGIDYVLLTGHRLESGERVRERIPGSPACTIESWPSCDRSVKVE